MFTRNYTLFYAAHLFLLPGFYVYQYLRSLGMQPYLGGYLVASAAIVLPIFFAYYAVKLMKEGGPSALDVLFLGASLWFGIWGLYFSGADLIGAGIENYEGAFFPWIAYFLLGRTAPMEAPFFRTVVLISHWTMLGVVAAGTDSGVFTLGVAEDLATYQAFALVFVVNLFFVLIKAGSFRALVFHLCIGALAVVVIGSRSEIIFILSFIVFAVVSSRYKLVAAGSFGLAALVAAANQFVIEMFPRTRFYDLYLTGGASTIEGREYANDLAKSVIAEYPLGGDFGSYPPGLYAHNILSVWVDFGLVGFILYILCLWIPFYRLLRAYFEGHSERIDLLTLALLSGCIVLVLISKSAVYYPVPFAIGFAASLLVHRTQHAVAMRA